MEKIKSHGCKHESKTLYESSIGQDVFSCAECQRLVIAIKEHKHEWAELVRSDVQANEPNIDPQLEIWSKLKLWKCLECAVIISGPASQNPNEEGDVRDTDFAKPSGLILP